MHVGKLMARLNPKNVRFDVGSGGIPELTSTDIAAALGMVDDGLGRELLCRVWWPDGAQRTGNQLKQLMSDLQRNEWVSREEAMLNAMLAVATKGNKARQLYADAHANRWPRLIVMGQGLPMAAGGYCKVGEAVLAEVCSGGLCQVCKGRGVVLEPSGPTKQCSLCMGSGHMRMSDRERAQLLGYQWSTYRDTWARVYDWTFQKCMDAIQEASRQMQDAVGDG